MLNFYSLSIATPIAFGMTISSAVALMLSPTMGRLYDRRGASLPLYIASASQLVSGALTWLMRMFKWSVAQVFWYAGAAFGGIAMTGLALSINPLMAALYPSRPGLAIAFAQLGNYISMILWPPIVAALLRSVDMFLTLLLLSLVSVIATALVATVLRGRAPSGSGYGEASSETPRLFKLLLIPIFLIASSSMMIISFLAPIISEVLLAEASSVMMLGGVAQVVGAVAWGLMLEKVDVLKALPATYLIQTATVLPISVYSGLRKVALPLLLCRLAAFAGEPVTHMTSIPRLFNRREMGRLLGLQNTAVMLASITAPVLGGLIRDSTGTYRAVLIASAMLSLLASLIAIAILLANKKR
jgi:predicted MFS family arabinose efflux permease